METIFWASKPSPVRILRMLIRFPFSSAIRERLPVLKYDGRLVDNIYGKDLRDKQEVIRRYNEINNEALNILPKDRSLVYDIKTGWEPLCKFLNVPVPTVPFPTSNAKEGFKKNIAKIAAGKEVRL